MRFEGEPGGADEGRFFTVTDIAEDKVVLDANHPLAGMALKITCTVVGVRPATPAEIENGARRRSRVDDPAHPALSRGRRSVFAYHSAGGGAMSGMMGFLSYGLGTLLALCAVRVHRDRLHPGHHAEEAHRPAQLPGRRASALFLREAGRIRN